MVDRVCELRDRLLARLPVLMPLQIERAPLASLVENPDNPMLHSKENLAAVRRSLEAFGQAEPLVVQKSSRKVIGGNGRLTVMREMGWEEADAVFLDVDDPTMTALGIALNRTGDLHAFDFTATAKLLADLRAIDFDLLATGFDEEKLKELLDGPEPPGEFPEVDEDIDTEYRCPKCSYEWSGQAKPGGGDGEAGDS